MLYLIAYGTYVLYCTLLTSVLVEDMVYLVDVLHDERHGLDSSHCDRNSATTKPSLVCIRYSICMRTISLQVQ